MSKKSRTKGAAFENELIKTLQEELGDLDGLRRNLSQYQVDNLPDLDLRPFGLDFFIEAKRYAASGACWIKPEWWAQCCQAAEGKAFPLLAFRYDRQPIRWAFPIVAINSAYSGTHFQMDADEPFVFNVNELMPVLMDTAAAMMVLREHLGAGYNWG